MPAEKFSISLPDTLARRIDDFASCDGVTRSALIQEATARYVAARDEAAGEERRRAGVDSALAAFEEIAADWGADSQTGVEHLAAIREGTERARLDTASGDVRG